MANRSGAHQDPLKAGTVASPGAGGGRDCLHRVRDDGALRQPPELRGVATESAAWLRAPAARAAAEVARPPGLASRRCRSSSAVRATAPPAPRRHFYF